MSSIGVILLAAGQSLRMGAQNKLLLPIAGRPMIRHVAEVYRAAFVGPLTIVTGHEAPLVAAALTGLDAGIVVNPDFASGQPGSVAAGLRAAPRSDLLLIGLGDQPLLRVCDLMALIDLHAQADPERISIPVCGQARGNPIVIPASLREKLLEDPARPGCMRLTRDAPHLVQHIEMQAKGFFTDVDTPGAYAALPTDLIRTDACSSA